MSDKATSFMQELDLWSEANVIGPLFQAIDQMNEHDDPARYQEGCERVKKAIRTKVLESYRNGQAAGRKPERRAA